MKKTAIVTTALTAAISQKKKAKRHQFRKERTKWSKRRARKGNPEAAKYEKVKVETKI